MARYRIELELDVMGVGHDIDMLDDQLGEFFADMDDQIDLAPSSFSYIGVALIH